MGSVVRKVLMFGVRLTFFSCTETISMPKPDGGLLVIGSGLRVTGA